MHVGYAKSQHKDDKPSIKGAWSITFAIIIQLPIRLSSVMFVHPTQPVEIFGNVSTPFGTLVIR